MDDYDRYGPWAVVAGASEGVGAAVAQQLAAAGVNVVLVARSREALEDTATRCAQHGAETRTLVLDLLASDALQRISDVTADLQVGLLVLNAGANTYTGAVVDGDLDAMRAVLDLNVVRPLELIHHFGGPMRQRGRGGLLLVGSLAGYLGQPGLATYSAAKAFSRVLAEGLWLELKPHSVDVLHLVLGVTRTPAMERAGLRFDLPGMNVAEPEEVARLGLAELRNGPVYVIPGNERTVESRSGTDRAALVERAAAAHLRLMGRQPP